MASRYHICLKPVAFRNNPQPPTPLKLQNKDAPILKRSTCHLMVKIVIEQFAGVRTLTVPM